MAIKFPLGQTVATPGALKLLEELGVNFTELLDRHMRLDPGELCAGDVELNHQAVKSGEGRVFSSYVITEWDRSVTTILLPEEY